MPRSRRTPRRTAVIGRKNVGAASIELLGTGAIQRMAIVARMTEVPMALAWHSQTSHSLSRLSSARMAATADDAGQRQNISTGLVD
jgi:hypothetical protein